VEAKAEQADFIILKRDLRSDYVLVEDFEALRKNVRMRAPMEDVLEVRSQLQGVQSFLTNTGSNLQHLMQDFDQLAKSDMVTKFHEMDANINKTKQQIEEAHAAFREASEKKADALQSEMVTINGQIKNIHHHQGLQAKKEDLDAVVEEMKTCVHLQHFDELKDGVLPQLEGYSKMIHAFTSDNQAVKECINAFDKSMCTKANKQSLVDFE